MGLLANLETDAKKTLYQTYTVNHGIDTFEVLIPIAKTDMFENQMKQSHKSKSSIIEIVRATGGILK